MVHDKWANVLFLHWRIPSHLEGTLKVHTSLFRLEKYDRSTWIGLIILTEEKVGPSIGRNRWTCVTHHGINVRTYVCGTGEGANDCHDPPKPHTNTAVKSAITRGIHFSSLECDDEFTSFGANFFGMPYRVAQMTRKYETKESPLPSASRRLVYRICSERLPSGNPSLFRMLFHALTWWRPRVLHSTITAATDMEPSNRNSAQNKNKKSIGGDSPETSAGGFPSQQFTVKCCWSHRESDTANDGDSKPAEGISSRDLSNEPFHEWAAERYFVYTHKYGRDWRGQVHHEPWPIETAPPQNAATHEPCSLRLESLEISGIDAYEPEAMRPILHYMAQTRPDHVAFSPGVGPVRFTMLQPV